MSYPTKKPMPDKTLMEYRKVYGRLLLDQGMTHREIHKITGLSRTTITRMNSGMVKTLPGLVEAIQDQEQSQLAEIALLSRSITSKRLIKDLENDDPDNEIPLHHVTKAQEVAFQQRRTLAGEASIIYDRVGASSRIDDNQARIEELLNERKAIRMSKDISGTYLKDCNDHAKE